MRPDTTSVSPLRWLIGTELERRRLSAQLTVAQASDATGIGRPKISHLEKGRQHQDPDDIALLLTAYGAPQHEIDQLRSLTGRSHEATWWTPWARVVPDWLKMFAGLEALADREFAFEPMLIPGLLQTADYAAAITTGSPRLRPDHTERFANFRVARAQRITDVDRPLLLQAVINEAALRLAVGTPDLRNAQLRHLLATADLPTVTLQVLRPEDGMHTATAGSFALLQFESARPVCYVEIADDAFYLQEQDAIETYLTVAEDLRQVALSPDKSAAYIESMLPQ